jgi:predicted nucleic acid-binding protein
VILVDTGILVAVANSRDNHHEMARNLLEGIFDRLLVPSTVIAEVCNLLSERAGAAAEVGFLRSFEAGDLELAELSLPVVRRMAELPEHYASLGLGGTDAFIVAIAERHEVVQIATMDRRHFAVVRPRRVDAFTLLPA